MAPMKNTSIKLISFLCSVLFSVMSLTDVIAPVGIGVPAGEVPQATLDIRYDSAVSPGFLMPRVTALPSGQIAEGMLIIYCPGCTDTDGDGQINYETGTYYVYVDNDGNGTSEWTALPSNAGVVAVDNEAPTSPSNLVASNPTSSTIDLSWTASTDNVGVSGYFIYLSDGRLAAAAPSNSITVSGLNPSTSYTFYVTAYDAAMNESGQSNNATQVTADTEGPTDPTNLVASNITTSSIDLSWNASTDNVGVVGYYVYQDGAQVGNVIHPTTATTISGLSESTQYSFYVRAYDAAGNLSGLSNTVTPTTLPATVTINSADFENNIWDGWQTSGGNSSVVSLQTNGQCAGFNGWSAGYVRLPDNRGDRSSLFLWNKNLSSYTYVTIVFIFKTNNFYDSNDYFTFEYKDGDGNWTEVFRHTGQNLGCRTETITILASNYNFGTADDFKFESYANELDEQARIHDVIITGHY